MQELRKLETAPTLATVGLMGIALGALLEMIRQAPLALVVLVPSVVLWTVFIGVFGNTCRYRPGWIVTLAWFHCAGLICLVVIGGVSTLLIWLMDILSEPTSTILCAVFVLAALLGVGRRQVTRFYERGAIRIARERLRVLCRMEAVARAKKRLQDHERVRKELLDMENGSGMV